LGTRDLWGGGGEGEGRIADQMSEEAVEEEANRLRVREEHDCVLYDPEKSKFGCTGCWHQKDIEVDFCWELGQE
jgi:hypothetical protein